MIRVNDTSAKLELSDILRWLETGCVDGVSYSSTDITEMLQDQLGSIKEGMYTVRGVVRYESELSWKVSSGPWKDVSLPKKLVTHDPATHSFTMPLWLAFNRELV